MAQYPLQQFDGLGVLPAGMVGAWTSDGDMRHRQSPKRFSVSDAGIGGAKGYHRRRRRSTNLTTEMGQPHRDRLNSLVGGTIAR